MHVKKGDKVIVIAGKEKGKTSTVVLLIVSETVLFWKGST
jgi:ribosomal protein L24